jgi:hypothetical protein
VKLYSSLSKNTQAKNNQNMKKYILLFCLLACIAGAGKAQVRKLKETSMVTGKNMTITIEGNYKDITKTPMKTQGIFLYRRDSQGLSLGNICAEQVMESYGFRYDIVPERHDISRRRYFLHNTWANIKLFFNNGPFWKARMQKQIDKCRQLSGDYVED